MAIEFKNVTFKYDEEDAFIFEKMNCTVEDSICSLIGQNGSGKTTFLLLAAGLIMPLEGDVYLNGINTKDFSSMESRQKEVSFIYQNMEFETEETIKVLLEYVYENSYHKVKNKNFISELIETLELGNFLDKQTQLLSKGELQRTIIAFSLLYGSKTIMMDEPIFALEDNTKNKIMKYLYNYSKNNNTSIYFSVHELNLSQKYSDKLMIFDKKHNITYGNTSEIFTKELIEKAYETPFEMLKNQEMINNQEKLGIS